MYHVTQLTDEAAEKHDRFAYNVPPESMLGWKPYNFRVTYNAVSEWACHSEEEFWRKCSSLRLNIQKVEWSEWREGMRYAILTKEGE